MKECPSRWDAIEIEVRCSKLFKQFEVENNAIDLSEKAVATKSSVWDNETTPPDWRNIPWSEGSGTWYSNWPKNESFKLKHRSFLMRPS